MALNRQAGKGRTRCRFAGVALIAVFIALLVPAAYGQVRQIPNSVEPGRDRPLPTPVAPDSDFDFRIEAPRRTPVPRAADELTFLVREIKIVGATLYSPDVLRELYAPLIGHEVHLGEILGVAEAIEAKYRRAGYVLTRAFVPPQRVADGVFTIDVVEGFISTTETEGGDPSTGDLIKRYLAPVSGVRPLDIATMERGLLLANDIPGVAAAGLLKPSPTVPGASDLVVTVVPTVVTGGVALDNRGSKFQGPWQVRGDVAYNGLVGPDQLFGSLATVPDDPLEKIVAQLRYVRPIGADGMTASFLAGGSYGEPGAELTAIELVTNSYAFGPRLHFPVIRSRAENLFLDGGLTVQAATVTALNQPLSHDNWRVLDASITYIQNGFLGGASLVTVGAAHGLPILGASRNGSPDLSRAAFNPRLDFTKFTLAARRAQPLYGPFSLAINLLAQYSLDSLISGEQASFGGDTIGRGYDPGVLQGDHGLGGSVELRGDFRPDDLFVELLQPYLFYDAAAVWNTTTTPAGGSALASAGVGLRAQLPSGVTLGVELAKILSRVTNNDNGRLSSRLLFSASKRF
jgi:hemolysin activation/secretion protein